MKAKNSFTYKHLICMVVVGCFVVMLLEPLFGQAYQHVRLSKLINDLEKMRICLEIYTTTHNELPPSDSFEAFQTAMTTHRCHDGFYLDRIPVNPFNGLNTVRFDGQRAGTGKAGWRFDRKTGLLQADDSKTNSSL